MSVTHSLPEARLTERPCQKAKSACEDDRAQTTHADVAGCLAAERLGGCDVRLGRPTLGGRAVAIYEISLTFPAGKSRLAFPLGK
jgi:hypothetical protein